MNVSFEVRSAILVLTIVLGIFLAAVVFRAAKNRWLAACFSLLNVSFIAWSLVSYLATIEYFSLHVTLLARLALFSAVIMCYLLVLVSHFVVYNRFPSSWFMWVWSTVALIYLPVTLTSYFFSSAEFIQGQVITHTGVLMPLFSVFTFISMIIPMSLMLHGLRHSFGDARKKITILLVGFCIMFSGFIGAILLPIVFFGKSDALPFGPLFIDIFFISLALVITRYELFKAKTLSLEVLAIMLNIFLLMQIWLSRGTQLFGTAILIFVVALITSVLFVENARRVMAIKVDSARVHALEESEEKLYELDRAKNDFVVLAAHQLRTPLSVVSGYVELLKDGAYGKMPPKTVPVLDNIVENNVHLSNLIDEFLDIAKIEEGIMQFKFEKTNLVPIVRELVAQMRSLPAAKHVTIKLLPHPEKCVALVDKFKIVQVCRSFLDNAIKYSEEGTISVSIKSEDSGAMFIVQDEGIGFRAVEGANLFHKFYRGSNAATSNANGVGVGLYLNKKYIDGHHGRIWGTSPGVGKGSEFGFWVPAEQPLT